MTPSTSKLSSISSSTPASWPLACLAALLLTFSPSKAEEAESVQRIVVVVNSTNPVAEVSQDEINDLFHKKVKKWDGGLKVVPADQRVESTVRKLFSKAYLGHSPYEIENWWQIQLFRGRAVPPIILDSDEEVLQYVAQHLGAIGYVNDVTLLPDGIRALNVTN